MPWVAAVEAGRWKKVREFRSATAFGGRPTGFTALLAHAARTNEQHSACGVRVKLLDLRWKAVEVNRCTACIELVEAQCAENG